MSVKNVSTPTSQTIGSTPGCAIYGLMPQEVTAQDGWMMSNAGAWLKAAQSFEITNGRILLSALLLLVSIGIFSYVLSKRFYLLEMDGRRYEMAGMAQTQDQGRIIYMPIFKEIK